jgi:hypothetical protein
MVARFAAATGVLLAALITGTHAAQSPTQSPRLTIQPQTDAPAPQLAEFSPDGSVLILLAMDRITRWDVRAGGQIDQPVITGPRVARNDIGYIERNAGVLSCYRDTIKVWNVSQPQASVVTQVALGRLRHAEVARLSLDQSKVVAAVSDNSRQAALLLWDARAHKLLWERPHRALSAEFNAAGDRIAIATQAGAVVFDLEGKEQPLTEQGARTWEAVFHPDGKSVALVTNVGFRRDLTPLSSSPDRVRLVELDGTPIREIRPEFSMFPSVIFSPDGTRLAVWGSRRSQRSSQTVGVFQLFTATGEQPSPPVEISRVLPVSTAGGGAGIVFSDDSRLLVAWGGFEQAITVWNTAAPAKPVLSPASHTRLESGILR